MALSEGSWLNHYEILGHLGSGGMGEVYRARDNKLQREVALKVLPRAFAQDPERIARFRREAQILAQVNHPNIAGIYSVEESGGTHFLVMELAQGETLRDRIKRGPIPIEEALDIAKQIASGLEAAHEKPIVHRDLKPANVKVTSEGVVKILDFGLARAFAGDTGSSDPSDSPTLTGMTQPGVILGTAAYMSPEQARGKTVDKRTDIWALGCVLYEMLTGKKAFDGEDVTDILGAVLHKELDWSALPDATPPKLRDLLRRCLQRDKDRRLRDAGDARVEMEDVLAASDTVMVAAAPVAPRGAPAWRRALVPAVALIVGILIGALSLWNLRPTPAPQPVSRFAVQLPDENPLQVIYWPSAAISPDGLHIAYRGALTGGQIHLRSLDNTEVRPIPGTQGGVNPFFSPDGQWLGFLDFPNGKLMKVALNGGPAVTLCDARGLAGAVWGPDDTIVFAGANTEGIGGLLRVSAAGGTPTFLAQREGETRYGWPEFLPGGKTLLFASGTRGRDDGTQIEALNLESGERKVIVQVGTYPRYAPTGHLVFYQGGTVMAVPFNPARLEVTGTPAPVLEGVMYVEPAAVPVGMGGPQFGFSQTGSLVYVGGSQASENKLAWVDRNGGVEILGAPPRAYLRPSLSPDGRRIAVNIQDQTSDVWVYDIARGTLTRLTFEGNNAAPLWMPDGERIVYPSARGAPRQLFWKRADGGGTEEQLTNDPLAPGLHSISRDGKLSFGTVNYTGQSDLGFVDLQGDRKVTVLLETPFDEGQAMISPDGRWLAYLSLESGRSEIYVVPFPGPGGKYQISTEGGFAPLWSRDGRELFYVSNSNRLMAVDITTGPTLQPGTPHEVLEGGPWLRNNQGRNYDVSPDGRRFLTIQNEDSNLSQLNVVLNWFEELKQRVPVP